MKAPLVPLYRKMPQRFYEDGFSTFRGNVSYQGFAGKPVFAIDAHGI